MSRRPIAETLIRILCALLLTAPGLALSQDKDPSPMTETQSEYQAMLEEAERARTGAEHARREATKAAEQAREMARQEAQRERRQAAGERDRSSRLKQREIEIRALERERKQAEMERVREELSRAHRELRKASREIAGAHRALASSSQTLRAGRQMNLGERAVIGVVLGRETAEGVEIIGISPGGPAERAGLQAGDLLTSIGGENLGGSNVGAKGKGRETLFRVMDESKAGETVPVELLRNGDTLSFAVTAERREPSSWQTMIRIPEPLKEPVAPGASEVIVERIEIPDIDEEAINARIHALEDELQSRRFMFVSPDGGEIEFSEELTLPDDFDFEIAELSELAGHALLEANVWFGLPQAQGLELAAINEGLGSYFKTERGVLVLKARPDNAYQLESGDVVLDINTRPVNSPTDLMRALREIEPGSAVEILIKRDHKNRALQVVMPESRLGYAWPDQPHRAPIP